MGFEIDGIDHHSLLLAVIGGQSNQRLGKDILPASLLPAVLECLVWPVFLGCVAPP